MHVVQPTHLAQRVQREIERRGGASGAAPVDTSDWEDRYSAMKAALPRFKSRKAEEAALRAEGDVLAATLARVRDDERALAAAARRREAAAGAEGYAEAHARLEQVRPAAPPGACFGSRACVLQPTRLSHVKQAL